MRQRPPCLSVLRNFESKQRLLVDELNRQFRDPGCRPSRLEGFALAVEWQAEHVAEYRLRLRRYNARRKAA